MAILRHSSLRSRVSASFSTASCNSPLRMPPARTAPPRITHFSPKAVSGQSSALTTVASTAAARSFSASSSASVISRSAEPPPFRHGSIKTSMVPPQTAGLFDSMSSMSSTPDITGRCERIDWTASRQTSASPQPPPTVPRIAPEAVTTICAPTSRGVEPRVETMVVTATVSPSSKNCLT